MKEYEEHPIPNGLIPQCTKVLIIGTFPPKNEHVNNKHFFFYSSPKNRFWNTIEHIFEAKGVKLKKTKSRLAEVSEKQNKLDKQRFVEEHHIGFMDIFAKIRRKKDSSKDSDIICVDDIISNGTLFRVLENNKNICRICCTYKLAYELIKCKLNPKDLIIEDSNISANGEKTVYDFKGRKIEIYQLYPASRSGIKQLDKNSQYSELLFSQ